MWSPMAGAPKDNTEILLSWFAEGPRGRQSGYGRWVASTKKGGDWYVDGAIVYPMYWSDQSRDD